LLFFSFFLRNWYQVAIPKFVGPSGLERDREAPSLEQNEAEIERDELIPTQLLDSLAAQLRNSQAGPLVDGNEIPGLLVALEMLVGSSDDFPSVLRCLEAVSVLVQKVLGNPKEPRVCRDMFIVVSSAHRITCSFAQCA
jgi:hypothetical protein